MTGSRNQPYDLHKKCASHLSFIQDNNIPTSPTYTQSKMIILDHNGLHTGTFRILLSCMNGCGSVMQ